MAKKKNKKPSVFVPLTEELNDAIELEQKRVQSETRLKMKPPSKQVLVIDILNKYFKLY